MAENICHYSSLSVITRGMQWCAAKSRERFWNGSKCAVNVTSCQLFLSVLYPFNVRRHSTQGWYYEIASDSIYDLCNATNVLRAGTEIQTFRQMYLNSEVDFGSSGSLAPSSFKNNENVMVMSLEFTSRY